MQKVRSRLVNFRVTDEELEQLRISCQRHGANCLSAFAREIMLNTLNAKRANPAGKLAALDRRLSALEVSLSLLVKRAGWFQRRLQRIRKVKLEVPPCES